ncbi:MAG: HAD-superfamily hydrolase, subfamily variant 1 [Devosia sp.]|uniref:HAD family hydrolase n=1 Tax=Devosia sp. TaxID=1871048 RepID=UPI0026355934|nr:HAD family hydrolase [Devosia sp.]MDB5530356.1 HAD-superfamily hydrolase, subfamily variant 1 [Devosia sp.]
MIKAVLFDLDETLLVRHAAIRAFIGDQYARHAAVLPGIGRDLFTTRFLALEDEGRTPKTTVYPALAAELGIASSIAADLLADYQALYPSYAVLSPGTAETLVALRAKGLKTGIVTNGSAVVQNGKIDTTGLRPLLDIVLVSEAEGLRKPDRRIFELALQRLNVAADEAIFVGDNPVVDVDGARTAGLLAVWYHSTTDWPDGLAPPGYAITALSEVITFCDEAD